jgi:flagellar hook-length control protein FliK
MNPSHSPTFSITESLRTPSKAASASSDRSSGGRASDSFSSIYHRETASFDNESQSKGLNINGLDEEGARKKGASNTANSQSRAEENEAALMVDESTLPGDIDEIPALAEHDLAKDDQAFKTELLHGISVALPSNSSQTKVGEILPPSGKELPLGGEHSEQKSLLTRPTTESELGDIDEIPALAEHDLAREDQTFETELLHGISAALPSNSPKTKVGEMLPPSGKELPLGGEHSEQKSLLTKPATESELGEVLTRADTRIEIRGRSNVNERSDRLRQGKVVDLNSTRSDPSMHEHRLETPQSKILSEALSESLALLTSKPLQDPATALTTGNNSPTNLSAVVSQIDSTAAQKLSLAADAAANTDLNASARNSSLDRSNVLGEKIHWMRNANISTAELHLHPAELGSIEIKIVTEDQQARVSFITSSATARDVIEESLPKLRELLADSGLALDQSDISQKESGDEPAQKNQQALPENSNVEREIKREFTSSLQSSRIGHIDHYV